MEGAISRREDFAIPNSLRFDGTSAYLTRTPSSAGNQKTWTWSSWIKRNNLGAYQAILWADSSSIAGFRFQNDDQLTFFYDGATTHRETTQKFRDPSAWMHLVITLDTTDDTAVDRIKIFNNGVRITAFDTTVNPDENDDYKFNAAVQHWIGVNNGPGQYNGMHLAEVHYIDGTALTPATFGETGDYGEWKPKEVSGVTYGTNGYYLDFASSGTGTARSAGIGAQW